MPSVPRSELTPCSPCCQVPLIVSLAQTQVPASTTCLGFPKRWSSAGQRGAAGQSRREQRRESGGARDQEMSIWESRSGGRELSPVIVPRRALAPGVDAKFAGTPTNLHWDLKHRTNPRGGAHMAPLMGQKPRRAERRIQSPVSPSPSPQPAPLLPSGVTRGNLFNLCLFPYLYNEEDHESIC